MSVSSVIGRPSTVIPRIAWRAELRLALLAAAESCWIYAIVLTLGTLGGFPRIVSPLGIFVMYWLGLLTGRVVPRSKSAWRLLQFVTIGIAFVGVLIAARIGLYTDVPLTDFSWLPRYVSGTLAFLERFTAEELSTIALILAFVRALGMAQFPLTLWTVGFQFRLGVVIFFFTAIVAGLGRHVDFAPWIFVYFSVSLLAISLARIEEAGQTLPLGWRWAGVLVTAIAGTMLVGFILTRIFTLEVVNAIFVFLSPVWNLVALITAFIAIPIIYVLSFLFNLIIPLLQGLSLALHNIFPQINTPNPDTQRIVDQVTQQLANYAPYMRLVTVIAIVFLVGWVIARALRRRTKQIEDEMYTREGLGDASFEEFKRQERAHRAGHVHYEINAENVRRIYAALQAHAESLGLARRDAETPLEYLPRLAAQFPKASNNLLVITDAYVAVHYAQRAATPNQVRELRGVWARTRKEMAAEKKRN